MDSGITDTAKFDLSVEGNKYSDEEGSIFVIQEGDQRSKDFPTDLNEQTALIAPPASDDQPAMDSGITDTAEFDLSGIYASKFLPKHDVDYWCFDTKKTFMIALKQEGNKIKGTFLSGITGEIEGTITNKKVEFTWYTARCNHGIKGEWTVDTGGSNLKGFGWSNLVWEAQKNN